MARVRFGGFVTGETVTIAASQSTGGSDSATVSNWGIAQSVSIVPTFTADRIAPDPVVFEAVPSGFTLPSLPVGAVHWRPAEHRLLYKWTFTASGRSWAYMQSPFSEWEDHDKREGPKVTQMVFDASSDFVATVEVWGENGEYATTSYTIPAADIVDPDTHYAGTDTVIVDPAGTGDPSRPSATVVTTFDAAMVPANTDRRILFKRGETFTGTQQYTMDMGSNESLTIGAWGSGADPIIVFSGTTADYIILEGDNTTALRSIDLDMRGAGDFVDDIAAPSPSGTGSMFQYRNEGLTAHINTKMSKHNNVNDNTPPSRPDAHLVFWNCDITEWRDYGIGPLNSPGSRISIVGCRIHQNPDIDTGGPKVTGTNFTYPIHGPVRLKNFSEIYIDACSFASYSGWGPVEDYTQVQPCLRLTEQQVGASIYVGRLFSVGGVWMTNTNTSAGSDNYAVNAVLDKIAVLQDPKDGSNQTMVRVGRGGTTLRNLLVVSDNVESFYYDNSSPYAPQLEIAPSGNIPGDTTTFDEPVEVYSVTLVDRMQTSVNANNEAQVDESGNTFNNSSVSGVVTHAPNKNTPQVPFAPMTEGSPFPVQSQWKGPAYRPGAKRYDLVNPIDASQTTGIIIDKSLARRFEIEGSTLTLWFGYGQEDLTGEQITFTGATPNGGDHELTGATRGANGTTATSHTAGSNVVYSGAVPRLTAFAATADFAAPWTPDTGSAALGGSNSDTIKPLDDIRGVMRTNVTDVDAGAFQVSS